MSYIIKNNMSRPLEGQGYIIKPGQGSELGHYQALSILKNSRSMPDGSYPDRDEAEQILLWARDHARENRSYSAKGIVVMYKE